MASIDGEDQWDELLQIVCNVPQTCFMTTLHSNIMQGSIPPWPPRFHPTLPPLPLIPAMAIPMLSYPAALPTSLVGGRGQGGDCCPYASLL